MFINWEEEGVGIGVVDVIVEADVDEVVEVLDVDKDDEVVGTDVVVDFEFTNFSLSISNFHSSDDEDDEFNYVKYEKYSANKKCKN